MQLSEHFSLEELTHSELAERRGIDNSAPDDVVENLRVLAEGLEQVRSVLAQPMHINSGYRSHEVNEALGSKETSAHRSGFAADFVCPSFGSPRDICEALRSSGIAFDQLIWEFSRWVHISFDPRMRGQVLTIDSNGTRIGLG